MVNRNKGTGYCDAIITLSDDITKKFAAECLNSPLQGGLLICCKKCFFKGS